VTYEGPEEEEDIHDAEGKASLEHRASLVDVQSEWNVRLNSKAPKHTKATVEEEGRVSEVRAISVCDSAEVPDACNECADEEQVDERHEEARMARSEISYQCEACPRQRQHRNYEEDEDGIRRELVLHGVAVDEPRQHADGGNEGQDLGDPP
jgi:hypothetical protein